MVDLVAFTNAMVSTLRAIPELVAALDPADPASIYGYVDQQPTFNSVAAAKYGQKPGSVMAVWNEAPLVTSQGGIIIRQHAASLYLRAQRLQSPYTLAHLITNGVPNPGDGQLWHYCPIMAGVERTILETVKRETDPEQVDLFVIETLTPEIGDP